MLYKSVVHTNAGLYDHTVNCCLYYFAISNEETMSNMLKFQRGQIVESLSVCCTGNNTSTGTGCVLAGSMLKDHDNI